MAAVPSAVHLPRCVVSPTGRHSASLIFLHGSGHSGQGQREWIKHVLNQDLTFQHIKITYPTAPSRGIFYGRLHGDAFSIQKSPRCGRSICSFWFSE
ncbi:lysophospholipase-like 1, isoform CRA_a [Mus musculus]|nr:lysophospholipase-like 1, isoform CRA_a [Mus musculus]